ncbi:unnamed protein product [Mytilus edulis]|uniref:Uncharacterized protein n=1 Tax=Mytilus edulis TaxID=6550 RepID=A0A8S3T912_MYTED|nr:unnamed protein product [Mytilus edulis]
MKGFIHETKQKRNYDARNAMHVISASVSGENISKGEKAKQRVSWDCTRGDFLAVKEFALLFLDQKNLVTNSQGKTRSDITPDITKKHAYDFWISPMVSRTSPNKTDVKRSRIGPREYVSQQIHLLEKTQTEVFLEFKAKYPDFKISQRYKPFFVMPVKEKHRNTCCCRQHTSKNASRH